MHIQQQSILVKISHTSKRQGSLLEMSKQIKTGCGSTHSSFTLVLDIVQVEGMMKGMFSKRYQERKKSKPEK